MKSLATIPKKFYFYQQQRFPVLILSLSIFPAILSSAAILHKDSLWMVCLVLVACLSYLLHIRIIDEHRDFEHDNVHHTDRPIQSGIISKKELGIIDAIAIIFMLVIAGFSGTHSLWFAVCMLLYSYCAGQEFFFGEKIRKYFFFYNTINLAQMILMQLFVYSVFMESFRLDSGIVMHFLFITTGTIIFEFMRKLKIPGDDGTGRDTYTWHLGFTASLAVLSMLVLVNMSLFLYLSQEVLAYVSAHLILSLFLAILLLFLIRMHWRVHNRQTDKMMQLSILLSYGILNLMIYFTVF